MIWQFEKCLCKGFRNCCGSGFSFGNGFGNGFGMALAMALVIVLVMASGIGFSMRFGK